MSTYEEKLAELKRKHGMGGTEPNTAPATAAPTSQGSKGDTFEERSAAIKKKWGASTRGAPSSSAPSGAGSADYPVADKAQTMRDAIPLRPATPPQTPSTQVNFAPMDQHQISGLPPGDALPATVARPGRPAILAGGLNTGPQPPVKEFDFATAGADVGAPLTWRDAEREKAMRKYLPSQTPEGRGAAETAADLANRKQGERLAEIKGNPDFLFAAIVEGRILPRDLADVPAANIPWQRLAQNPDSSWFKVGRKGLTDPEGAKADLLGQTAAREGSTAFQLSRGLKTGSADALTLGVQPPDVFPQTGAERAGFLTGEVLGQIPLVAGAAATGGVAAGAGARALGIANPLAQAAIQAAATGATISTAQEAAQGLARTGQFDARQAARNILSTTAEYAAFGPVYEGLGIAGEAIGKKAPALARAVQAIEHVPIAGEVITGGVKGALAGGIVGMGKAVLDALATPAGRDAKSFVQTVLSNAQQEMSEELVEAIAFGIVRKFVPLDAGAVLATAHTLKADTQAPSGASATAAGPLAPTNAPTTPSPTAQAPAPASDRATILRTANPGMDERAIVGMVNTTSNLSDGEFQGFVERVGKPEATATAAPVAPAVQERPAPAVEPVPVPATSRPLQATPQATAPTTSDSSTSATPDQAPPLDRVSLLRQQNPDLSEPFIQKMAKHEERLAVIREKNPGIDEQAARDAVREGDILSDADFQKYADLVAKQQVTAPAPNPTPGAQASSSNTGLAPVTTPATPKQRRAQATKGQQTPLPPAGLTVRTGANYKGEAQRKAASDYTKAIGDWAAQNGHDLQGFQLVRALFSDGQWRPAIRTTQANATPAPGWVGLPSERGGSAGAFYAVDHSYQPPAPVQQDTPATAAEPVAELAPKGTAKSTPATGKSAREKLRQKTEANTATTEGGFLSLGGGPNAGKQTQADTEPVAFDDAETEARWKASKGIRPESFRQKFAQFMTDMKNKFTREFEHLPRTAEHAEFRDKLHKVTKGKGIASDEAIRYLQGITVKMREGEYDLFVRKVILDDLMEEMALQKERLAEDVAAGKEPWEVRLPFGITEQTLPSEHAKVSAAAEQTATVKQAVEDRKAIAKELVDTYVQTAKDAVGFTPPLNRQDYYRHQVLAYAGLKTLKGTGGSLKAPTNRGFLKARAGSAQDINTNYLEAEHEFLSQILYDTNVFKTLQFVKQKYDVEAKLKAQAKVEGTHWRDLIPDGYTVWKPDSRSVVYNAWSLPAKYADAIQDKALDEIGVTKADLRQVKVMGGSREQLVIPEAVAKTLDTFGQRPANDPVRWVVSKWKGLALMGPRRVVKYNLRNLTGDLDAMIAGNPKGATQVPKAVSDLYVYLINGGAPSAELVEWIGRGGLQDTLGVAESVGNINGLALFRNIARQKGVLAQMREGDLLAPVKATWAAYGRVTRGATDFREAILRYANYRSYLDQMQKANGKPGNFGASLRDEVMALPDVRDRAYKLSNDLMGAYDEVTVAGQYIRDRLFPFWSWNEVNFKRNTRLIKNAVQDGTGTAAVGRSVVAKLAGVAVKSPLIAYNVGKFALKATALTALLAAWNHLMFPDEEKELPDSVKSRPYIIFGRDRDGKVVYFSRLGALHDFLEWFGLADSPQYVRNYLDGSMSIKEIVTEMAKSPVKKLVGGFGIYATPFEVVMGKALYPDPFRPRAIRDRWEHLAEFVGFGPEYRELAGKPTRGYLSSAQDLVTYRLDPAETAYYDAIGVKYDWLEKKKGVSDISATSPKSNALYYLKQAIRLGDREAMEKYMLEYAKFGGTKDGLGKSLETMHPLYGISKADRKAFLESLSMRDRETLRKAEVFYKDVLEAGDVKTAPGFKELPRK